MEDRILLYFASGKFFKYQQGLDIGYAVAACGVDVEMLIAKTPDIDLEKEIFEKNIKAFRIYGIKKLHVIESLQSEINADVLLLANIVKDFKSLRVSSSSLFACF